MSAAPSARAAVVLILAVFNVWGCGGASMGGARRIAVGPAFSGVEVYRATAAAARSHPRQVDGRVVGEALRASGHFLDGDVRAIAPAVAAEFARLGANEELWVFKAKAVFRVFVAGDELVVARWVGDVEETRTVRPLAPFTAPARAPAVATPSGSVPAPAKSSARAGAHRIWTFAVGVSRYKDRGLNLKYADRDATAVDRFFAARSEGGVPAKRRVLLTNAQATRSAILSQLLRLSRRAGPDDVLIIYLAMHGLPDDGGDLYFVAHDTDPAALVGTGLPQRDVEYALGGSPAKRIVMLLDACHAGAAGLGRFQGKRGLAVAETNRLLSRLADTRPGVAVLTASSATEPSNEGRRWGGGHGVFTHFLLDGLGGAADADQDRIVTIRELYDFVYEQVSDATDGRQHPELKGRFDNGMPLAATAD